jgi:hypothetical protein
MDPLTGNVCRLSRVEAYAVTSSAGRYTALFKAVLCGWGENCGPRVYVAIRVHVRHPAAARKNQSFVNVSTRILIIEVAGRLVGENKRMIVGERSRDRDALLPTTRATTL